MAGFVSTYIQHFTYSGLFLVLVLCGMGLPIPEDIALLAGGYLAHRGITQYPPTLVISFVGVIVGDNSLFFLGRRFGTSLVTYLRMGPESQRQIDRLKTFMDKHGHLAIFYARFLAGIRALVYLTAGSLEVRPSRFLFYDALGAVISVPIVVSIGYFFGAQIGMVIHYLGGFERLIWVVILFSALFFLSRHFNRVPIGSRTNNLPTRAD